MAKKQLYIFLLLVFSLAVSAQQNKISTSIDTTRNRIGAQFNLTLKTTVDTASIVVFPKQTQFGALEVIRSYPVDTVKKDNQYELVKKYGLTQFDSGKYTIPRLSVLINKNTFFSDSLRVEVANVKVDTLKQKMYDIKDIVHTDKPLGNWWVYLLLLIAVALIGFIIYTLLKRRHTKKAEAQVYKTPIEKATSLLQQLEKKELWQKGEVKNYYSELTDIARNYIEEAIKIPAMESTTSELIVGLRMAAVKKNMSLTQETVINLEKVLKQADLVKFAKEKPLDFEIAEDRKKIEKAIVTLDQSIPEEKDDEAAMNEFRRQQVLKKQKTRRIIIAIGSVFFLLFATLIFFIATKGFDYVKDNIIGHPTKDLVEGEWITSEYGNPGVKIETPKVLKRMDVEKTLSKEAIALLKEFQMFSYGSMTDNFYVLVSTNKYSQPVDVNLDLVVEGYIKELEKRGASNILLKQDEFSTPQGISGRKAYGTMVMLDKIRQKSHKMYYEILYFKQDQGLQQVMVTYEEGDEYGKELLSRIINSVELQQIAQ